MGLPTLGLGSNSRLLTLGLGLGSVTSGVPQIINISPEDGIVAVLGAPSRVSLRVDTTEINLSALQVYLGNGLVFYRGGTLPEELLGPPTFYFEALSGFPNVPADRLILPDDYLRISKSIPSQNQEAVYLMGGLEAPAEPDAPMMFEFRLRLNKTEVTPDGAGFTGVMVGMLIGNGGVTVKFCVSAGVPRIEIHDAGLSTTSPPSSAYVFNFDWNEAAALNTDGSNTYKLLWHPQKDLVRLYVKNPSMITDRLLINGAVTDFPLVPAPERRANQPWMFFGHGNYATPVSISEWKDVFLYNVVTNPIWDGIIAGGHVTKLTTNNPVYYDGKALPRDSHCAWLRLPASFGSLGAEERLTQDGLVLERPSYTKSIGFYRVEPRVTTNVVFDIRLSGKVLAQEPGVETSGIEFYIDDGTRQARVALLQDSNGSQYVGILEDSGSPSSLVSYLYSPQSFDIERNYRLVLQPGLSAELIMLVTSEEGIEEQPVLSVSYAGLPLSGMPGPGVGFLHNANSGGVLASVTVRQVRYVTDAEIADFNDFDSGAWTKIGLGTYTLITVPPSVVPSYGRIADASSSDNTYFKKEFAGTALQPDSGWSLEFRARVVSYEHDPALTRYLASGLNPIRASTGFMVQVLDGGNRAALIFAEVGPPDGKIVFLATQTDTYRNFMDIRSKKSSVAGTYGVVDWTKFHLYRLEKTVGGLLQLFVDESLTPMLEFNTRDFDFPPHIGGGNPRVELGHAEVGIKTVSDFQLVKFSASNGFDVSCNPVLTDEELNERFLCATNVLVEAESV